MDPMNARAAALPRHSDIYLRVINALLLRDMRSRFGGSYWGYLLQMLWPCAHVILLVSIMTVRHMPSPMGESTMVFVASGAVPALGFKYISREVMKAFGQHKTLTYFPQVKRFDTIVARILVEIVGSFMGIGIICLFLIAFGNDPVPVDITTSLTGYFAAIMLGIGVGTVNVGIVSVFQPWLLIYILIVIIIYLISGVYFMACYMPEKIYWWMKWNPITQVIEWVRLGYDPSLPIEIDYLYVISWIFTSLTIGLLMERYIARHK